MSQKDLKQPSTEGIMPALAHLYMSASLKVYGTKVTVVRTKWPRFAVFEDDLRELHVPIKDYAYSVSTMLKTWCKSHNFRAVPINVFTGDWALSKFMKVWQSETVTISEQSDTDEILHSELMVARLYVSTMLTEYVRLSAIVESCKDLLSPAWYKLYIDRDRRRNPYTTEAITMLCMDYGISTTNIESYADVVRRLS